MSKTQDVIKLLYKTNFAIPVDEDGELKYVVCRVNTENFVNLPDSFVQQLKDEGKYGWYVSFFTRSSEYTIERLPIYGDANRWVTKWLKRDMEDVIKSDLRDKWMGVYERILDFKENRDLLKE